MANENISWRNGHKVIIHLTDAGAHGKLFTKSDKYPEEEPKLIQELEKCALKNIKIFGMFEMPFGGGIIGMNPMMSGDKPKMGMAMGMGMGMNNMNMMMGINSMNRINTPNPMMGISMGMNPMMMNSGPMINMSHQEMVNSNFRINAINSISNSLKGINLKKDE